MSLECSEAQLYLIGWWASTYWVQADLITDLEVVTLWPCGHKNKICFCWTKSLYSFSRYLCGTKFYPCYAESSWWNTLFSINCCTKCSPPTHKSWSIYKFPFQKKLSQHGKLFFSRENLDLPNIYKVANYLFRFWLNI